MPIIRVALDVPLSTLFDYEWKGKTHLTPGQRVLVPFGRGKKIGVVMGDVAQSEIDARRIKAVLRVLDESALLPSNLLRLLEFCSDYYQYPLGATVLSALPARLRESEPVALKEARHYALSVEGWRVAREPQDKRKVVRARILSALRAGPIEAGQIRGISPGAPAAFKALLEAGWVETVPEPEPADPGKLVDAHVLTPAQRQAVETVSGVSGYACHLLHGVTGSGKTEVYAHLMHRVLKQGGQVLLLVPEINLTPQLEHYFRSSFPDAEVASLHSGLAEAERARNWLRAQSGRAHIVLGTRLAVFAPMPALALIIVDEEHDLSYKQQDGLRYSARDVAVFRASQAKIPVLLGSATPTLESWYNAKHGRYRLLSLPERAHVAARLPEVRCVNIAQTRIEHGISETLFDAMGARIQRGEQSLLFINRRGYAPVLMCAACGWLSGCPNCAGRLVLHLRDRRLRCHHCGHQARVPPACPECGNADLKPVGMGTQRVEEALKERFPHAHILRVDRDSTRNKGSWRDMRKQIQEEAVDILVGTQILAKGHDFPNLTLVGVLNPDGALFSSNYRASESLFAQLAQVAGRAGRADKPGEVLIQTAFPGHTLFRALGAHNYSAWAESLLEERKLAGFPPYTYQVLLRCEGVDEAGVFGFMRQAHAATVGLEDAVDVYGVVPAAMPRRANRFMAQLLVQCSSRKPLHRFLAGWRPMLEALPAKKLRWSLDVDPVEI